MAPEAACACLDALEAAEHRHVAAPLARTFERLVNLVRVCERPTFSSLDYVIRVASTALRRQCEDRILLYPYADLPSEWRALYTDTLLLCGCAAVQMAGGAHDKTREFWLEMIRALDTALIVSIRPGETSATHAHRLIAALQDACGSDTPAPRSAPKRPRRDEPVTRPHALYAPIPEQPKLSEDEFVHDGSSAPHGRPFVVRGYARHWRAMQPAASPRWADASYLCGRAGPGRVVPVEQGGGTPTGAGARRSWRSTRFSSRLAGRSVAVLSVRPCTSRSTRC